MPTKILDLEQLLRIPAVDVEAGFDLSPDGQRLAFSSNRTGRWEVYELLLSSPDLPRQVTSGQGAKFSPRYAPDGSRLAYLVDFDGGEDFRLFVLDFASGVHTGLTPDHPGALQPNYCWSPDSTQFALISNQSGCFNTYVMSAAGGPLRPVFELPYMDWDVRWSPDGHWLAVVTHTHGQDFGIYIVSPDGRELHPLGPADVPLAAKDARWSPDSAHLAFSSDILGSYNLGLYSLHTQEITWLTAGPGDKEAACWSPDGQRLAYIHTQAVVSSLAVLDIVTGQGTVHTPAPGVVSWPRFSPHGEHVYFIFNNPRQPDDLWRLSLSAGSFQQLTASLPAGLDGKASAGLDGKASAVLDGKDFILPEAVHYPSLDGIDVPALLFKPPGAGPASPAVVIVHGGPNWLYQVTWHPLIQHMLSRGWVVLAPNYRGSTGYGREWQQANRFDMGGVDTRDVVAGALFLAHTGLADPQRIAVTGASHGGYLTMTCLTGYPEIFAAGSAHVPFLNWFTSHTNSRQDLQHWDIENFGSPEQHHDLWHERSPFFFLDQITAPVQLICGGNDPRCAASESLQARDRLLALGKSVDFNLYPDEGHGFLKIENVVDAAQRRIAFLAGVLEPSGE